MPILSIPDFEDVTPSVVHWEQAGAENEYGDASFGGLEYDFQSYIEEFSFEQQNTDIRVTDARGVLFLPYNLFDDPEDNTKKVTVRTVDRLTLPEPFEPRCPEIVGVDIVSDENGPHHLEVRFK